MRIAILAAAVVAFGAPAFAQTDKPQVRASTEQQQQENGRAASARVVYVCDFSDETHRGLAYITAAELSKAQASNEAWSAPRCISEVELQRYERTLDDARVERARAERR